MSAQNIKVVIVDDHRIFIDGIASLFVDDNEIEVAGYALNKQELIDTINDDNIDIDVVLLDLNLGDTDGVDIITELRNSGFDKKIIALTMYNLPNLVKKVLSNGGDGYILKNTSKADLKEAIIEVYKGNEYLDNSLKTKKTKLKDQVTIDKYPDDFLKLHNLSKREYEIIILLAESYSSKEIAEALFISEQTVSTYRKNIKSKLNFKSTADIVRFVFENNLI